MNTKTLFFLLLLSLITYSCNYTKKEYSDESQNREEQLTIKSQSIQENSEKKESSEQKIAQDMLKSFYTEYINENSEFPLNLDKIDSLIRMYGTSRLLEQLDNPDIDYDLFLDGHTCEKDWINTLSISTDSTSNDVYVVSFKYEVNNEKKNKRIKLRVLKGINEYKIDEIMDVPVDMWE